MSPLLDLLAEELERVRPLPAQVTKHLASNYGIGPDEIGAFLVNEVPGLEDFEIDLILSPVFTPGLRDQAVFAELLGRAAVPPTEWPELVRQLAARPTRAPLVAPDGVTYPVQLREVTLERFVHRLCLDGAIPEALFNLLSTLPPSADRPLLKAIARRPIWRGEARREILSRHLLAAARSDDWRTDDAVELLRLVETYQPADAADLLGRIPPWREALRREINAAFSPKPFLNERVEEMHGGGRDQRPREDARINAKELEIATLERLAKTLAA